MRGKKRYCFSEVWRELLVICLEIGLCIGLPGGHEARKAAVDVLQEETAFNSERDNWILQTGSDKQSRRYQDFNALCENDQMTIQAWFHHPFRGRIYSDGYADDLNCGILPMKAKETNFTVVLSYRHCGVHMITSPKTITETGSYDLKYEVTLYIQYSSQLQQVVDERVTVSCRRSHNTKGNNRSQSSQNIHPTETSRQSRRLKETHEIHIPNLAAKIGESWMEVLEGKEPSPKNSISGSVSVGDDITLAISTKVKHGFDARIVNCSANDGSSTFTQDGFKNQRLIDSTGCSVDPLLMPGFRRRRLPIESRSRLTTIHFASFPAFKFPEREHIHFKCFVAYCKGLCPQPICLPGNNHFGSWKEKYGRISNVLIDTTQVVNSIQVTSPELESIGRSHRLNHPSFDRLNGRSSSEETPGGSIALADSTTNGRQFSDTTSYSHHAYGQPVYNSRSPNNAPVPDGPTRSDNPFPTSNNVCVSPGTVILALVILGVVLVVSATATLWFALKRSESRKSYPQSKHPASPFQHTPNQPYYRFTHW